MVQYCDTVLNKKLHGRPSTYEALSVIKTCQVIRMLTAYAVTIGRTVARGWRVFVRSSSATRKRHRREFQIHARSCSVGDMDAVLRDLPALPAACAIVRPGLHEACLAVRVGCATSPATLVTGQLVTERCAELSPSNGLKSIVRFTVFP